MALKLIGAVGIKVRPEAENFRDEAERDIKRQLRDGIDVPVRARPEMDRDELKRDFDRHKKAMQRELDRISDDLKFDGPTISSEDARRELRDLRSASKRTYQQMTNDARSAAGAQKVLARHMGEELDLMGKLEDSIRSQSSGSKGRGRILALQEEINQSVNRQNGLIREAGDAYEREVTARRRASEALTFGANQEANALARVRSELDRLERGRQRRLGNQPALTEAERIAQQLRDNARIKFEFDADTRRAEKKAHDLKDYIDDLEANLHVGVDGEHVAAAQMKWLTRPRRAMIHAVVSAKSIAVAEGLLNSIAGVNALKSLGQGLEKIITDFDKFSLKAAGWTTLIGSISNAALAGATAMFSIGDGLVRLIGLGAMAPTMFGAIGTSAVVATTALKDFFTALKSGDVSNLVGNARKEAEAVKGTWTELSEEIKGNFWENAGSNFSGFILGAMPTLKRGLGEVAAAMGKSWDNIFSALRHSTDMGYLDSMFDGLSEGMENASHMMDPLVRGIMRLGARGAEYLPQFGNWLTDIGEGFEDWINKADEAGDINRWIEDGVQSLKDLGNVSKGTWNVLTGLSEAALAIGGPTLNDLASGMLRVGEAMHTAKGQFITREILGGALEGWKLLASGLGDFFVAIGDNIGFVKQLEISVGRLGGTLFRNLSEVIRNEDFTSGVVQGFDDIGTAMVRLKPSFRNMGTLLGDMTRVSGAVFKGITPTINAATETIANFVHELSGPVIDLIPRLTAGMGAIINLVDTPIQGGGRMISGIIDGFNKLPGPIQTAVLSLGGLLAMRPQIRGFGDAIMRRVVPATSRFGQAMHKLQTEHMNAGKNISMTTAAYRTFKQEMAASARMASSSMRSMSDDLTRVNRSLGEYQVIGNRAFKTVRGELVNQTGSYNRLVDEQQRLTRSMRDAEFGATRFGSAFSALDRAFGDQTRFTEVGQGISRIGDGFRNLGRSASTSLSTATTAFTDFGRVTDRFTRNPLRFDNMFAGINRAASQAKRGFADIASGAGKAAAAIGVTAGAGLRRAASGLMGALGGPWGLAIAGAAVGLGMIAQSSAEAKQRIQNLQSTLDSSGNVTAETRKAYTQLGGSFKELNTAAENASIPLETLNKAIEGDAEAKRDAIAAYDKYLEKQYEVKMNGQDQTGALIGQAAGQKRMTKALEEANEEYEKAVAKQEAMDRFYTSMGDKIGTTGAQAKKMSGAMGVLGEEMQMASVQGETLFAAVDSVTSGLVAGQDAAFNYQSGIANMKKELSEWTGSYGSGIEKISSTLEKNNGMLDMTKQSHRELYSILRSQIEPAYQQVADAFNRAGGGEKGRQAARKSMSGIRDDWMNMLTDQVGMTDEAAASMLNALNINPDAIEMILDDGDMSSKLDEITKYLRAIAENKTVAEVEADIKGEGVIDSFKERLAAIDSTKTEAELSANAKDLFDKLTTADGKLKVFETQEYLAKLAAKDNVTGIANMVQALLDSGFNNKTYEATLKALDEASGVAEGVRDKIVAAVVNQDFEAAIKLAKDANVDGELDGLIEKLKELDAQDATPGINEPQGAAAAQGVITNLGMDLTGLDGTTATPTLGLLDNATEPMIAFTGKAVEYDGSEYAGVLALKDYATDQLYLLRDLVDAFASQNWMIPVSANTTPAVVALAGLQGTMRGLLSSQFNVRVGANVTPAIVAVAGLQGTLRGFLGANYMVTIRANTTPAVAAAAGLMGTLRSVVAANYMATIRANATPAVVGASNARNALRAVVTANYTARINANASGAVRGANQALDAIRRVVTGRYMVRIDGESNGVTRAAHNALDSIRRVPRNTHVRITAHTYGTGRVNALAAAISRVRSKTVVVNVVTRGRVPMADGGILQQFADGGITGVRKGGLQNPFRNPTVRTIEHHTAQIAPAGAMRLWAEPETGGEAYIPLSPAKRTRSEAILGQVADRFGMRLERYANGSSGTAGGSSEVVSAGGDTYNINVESVPTNVTEETTSAIMFNLKHMKRGGGLAFA